MGCTVSLILIYIYIAMEVTLKAADGNTSPANLDGGYYKLPLKAFMDYTTEPCRWYDSSMKDTRRGQQTAELDTEGLLARVNSNCGAYSLC